jgi:hypothetical protein
VSCYEIRNIATLDRLTALPALHIFYLMSNYGSNFCRIRLETAPLREPNRNLKDFTLFNIDLKHRNCPSAGSASVSNNVRRDIGIFNGRSVLLNEVLYYLIIGTKIYRGNKVIFSKRFIIFHSFMFVVRLSFLNVALRPNAGHGLLILEVSRSHTTTHHSR